MSDINIRKSFTIGFSKSEYQLFTKYINDNNINQSKWLKSLVDKFFEEYKS